MLYGLLLFFCLYLPFQLALNLSEGVDLASVRVFLLILGLFWLLKSLKNKELAIPYKFQSLLLFSFLFLNAFSFIFSENIEWAGRKLLFFISFIPLYLIIPAVINRHKERAKKIIEFLVLGAGLISLVGLIQFTLQFFIGLNETLKLWQIITYPFLGSSFSQAVFENQSWLVGISGNIYLRAIAFFPDPHMFSFYLGMLLPWTIAVLAETGSKAKKILFLIIFIFIFFADILTFSRGGYLGLLAGLIFTLLFFRKKITENLTFKKTTILSVLFLLIATFAIFPNPVNKRLYSSFSLVEGSNKRRIEIWKESLEMIKINPFGVGLGNYAFEVKPSADYREPIYSHNLYFDIAAETGILNALIFILLILSAIINFLKKSRIDKFYIAGAVSLIIFSVHSLFETPIFSVHNLPLLLIVLSLSVLEDE